MLNNTKNRFSTLLALAGALNLAGCGQTGPLYLPQKLAQAAETALASPPTTAIAALRGA